MVLLMIVFMHLFGVMLILRLVDCWMLLFVFSSMTLLSCMIMCLLDVILMPSIMSLGSTVLYLVFCVFDMLGCCLNQLLRFVMLIMSQLLLMIIFFSLWLFVMLVFVVFFRMLLEVYVLLSVMFLFWFIVVLLQWQFWM